MADLVIHEWIEKSGGSEMVLDDIVSALPDADIFCLWKNDPDRYAGRKVTESWLSRTPLRKSKMLALPFMPATWSSLNTAKYDRVVVSSHLFAHHAGGRKSNSRADNTFVYVHTPARYLWTPELDKRGSGVIARTVAATLKPIDRGAAQRPRALAANSTFVQQRIADTWQRESTVIYPPVNVDKITQFSSWADQLRGADLKAYEALPAQYVLGASRFVAYKELDRVIDVAAAVGLPVVLAGHGAERVALEEHARKMGVPVTFVDRPSNALLYALYQSALVYVFPAVEDFGIMPVEAMATGAPVIVGTVGGAIESVVDGVTGVHLPEWTPSAMADAVQKASALNRQSSIDRARQFDSARFQRELLAWIEG